MGISGVLPKFVVILAIVVGLLSGVLSVIREIQAMYKPPKAGERPVFWGFVRIAFVISAVLLWVDEHGKVVGGPISTLVITPPSAPIPILQELNDARVKIGNLEAENNALRNKPTPIYPTVKTDVHPVLSVDLAT